MIVLGINEDHNAAAALVRNGEVVACASEERFSRVKNDVGYPRHVIDFVLKKAGVKASDLNSVVYGTLTGSGEDAIQYKIKRVTKFTIKDYIREMHEYWKPVLMENRTSDFWETIQKEPRFLNTSGVYHDFSFLDNMPREKWAEAFHKERIDVVTRHLGIPASKVFFVDHHKAHANYAYFASPVDRTKKTAVVTADGWGDDCNATISIAQGNTIKEVFRTDMCHLARIYRWITLSLAFKPNEHEYKVMGLAPYAKDYIRKPAYEIFKETLVVDGLDFKWRNKPSDMYFYFKDKFERNAIRFDGIAGGLQQWVEEMMTQWITNILTELGAENLVYSGGLSMNVKVNKIIAELPQVKDFFVPPSGGDESLCMGAAFVMANKSDAIKPLVNAYLGSAPDSSEVQDALAEYKAEETYRVERDPTPDRVAELLAQGMVIARCVGGMEFGARSLGNRSILCDPSDWDNVRKINEMIKFRDFWMPFTPSILAERAKDYIINPKNLKAPFMTVAFESTPLGQRHIKAAVHPYDFTARPQVLDEKVNPEYYAIIKAFEKRTGIGCLLNTSLNLHGMPIVRTAHDAFYTFANSGLDGLLLLGVLILKK